MTFDFWLFDIINGFAGHWRWLDMLGRGWAIYGLLAVILLALAVLWWPRWPGELRRRYLLSLALSAVCCGVLLALEWFITTQVLHHELRSRPANARWATVLIAVESARAFPSWPVLLAFALAIPTLTLAKRSGMAMLLLASLLGVALVFVGVNFPIDIVTGALLGSAIGYTAMVVARGKLAVMKHRWRWVGLCWIGIIIWGILVAVMIKPAQGEGDSAMATAVSAFTLTPPQALLNVLRPIAEPGTLTAHASGNGHRTVMSARVILPNHEASLYEVKNRARRIVNCSFSTWAALDLLTVEISANFAQGTDSKIGTLYTVTVDRAQFPPDGFAANDALPGKKFFHPRYLRDATTAR